MDVLRTRECVDGVGTVDEPSVGNEASVGDLHAYDDCAVPDEAPLADHRIVNDGLEPDERVVADVAGAMNERVVRDR